MFTADIIHDGQKVGKKPYCPLNDEYIKKMWSICTKELYLVIKSNAAQIHAALWIKLENNT